MDISKKIEKYINTQSFYGFYLLRFLQNVDSIRFMISIIFPVHNEEGNVEELYKLNKEVLEKLNIPYEIIVVDDCSTDKTLNVLKKLSPIRIISLARNFGQTAALEVGINAAKGDLIVIMDGDLQNDPRNIPALISKLDEGYDVVCGWRKNRHDNWFRRIHSHSANWLARKISGLNIHDHACALKIFKMKFLKDIRLYGVQHVFLAAQAYRNGAKVVEIEVDHHSRKSGLSKHHLTAGIKAIADLIMVRFLSPDTRPFVFFSAWGLWTLFFAILFGIASVLYSSFLLFGIALFVFVIGFLILICGFLSETFRRIYLELKTERPYMIREIIEK